MLILLPLPPSSSHSLRLTSARLAAAQLSCQLSARDLSTTSSAIDTAAFTLDPENCPYCAKALANESEGGTEGNETPGDSDSDGVYEFTQDLHHKDRRDSRQPRRKRLRLGKTAAHIVRFWRLVCDTFRKIVDSKYFGRGIMIAILINTLSMGIEYHEQVSQHQCISLCLIFQICLMLSRSGSGEPSGLRYKCTKETHSRVPHNEA